MHTSEHCLIMGAWRKHEQIRFLSANMNGGKLKAIHESPGELANSSLPFNQNAIMLVPKLVGLPDPSAF